MMIGLLCTLMSNFLSATSGLIGEKLMKKNRAESFVIQKARFAIFELAVAATLSLWVLEPVCSWIMDSMDAGDRHGLSVWAPAVNSIPGEKLTEAWPLNPRMYYFEYSAKPVFAHGMGWDVGWTELSGPGAAPAATAGGAPAAAAGAGTTETVGTTTNPRRTLTIPNRFDTESWSTAADYRSFSLPGVDPKSITTNDDWRDQALGGPRLKQLVDYVNMLNAKNVYYKSHQDDFDENTAAPNTGGKKNLKKCGDCDCEDSHCKHLKDGFKTMGGKEHLHKSRMRKSGSGGDLVLDVQSHFNRPYSMALHAATENTLRSNFILFLASPELNGVQRRDQPAQLALVFSAKKTLYGGGKFVAPAKKYFALNTDERECWWALGAVYHDAGDEEDHLSQTRNSLALTWLRGCVEKADGKRLKLGRIVAEFSVVKDGEGNDDPVLDYGDSSSWESRRRSVVMARAPVLESASVPTEGDWGKVKISAKNFEGDVGRVIQAAQLPLTEKGFAELEDEAGSSEQAAFLDVLKKVVWTSSTAQESSLYSQTDVLDGTNEQTRFGLNREEFVQHFTTTATKPFTVFTFPGDRGPGVSSGGKIGCTPAFCSLVTEEEYESNFGYQDPVLEMWPYTVQHARFAEAGGPRQVRGLEVWGAVSSLF